MDTGVPKKSQIVAIIPCFWMTQVLGTHLHTCGSQRNLMKPCCAPLFTFPKRYTGNNRFWKLGRGANIAKIIVVK